MQRDGTKRYRVLNMDFDARPNILSLEIRPEWDTHIQEQHRRNKNQVRQSIIDEYGKMNLDAKIQDFQDFGVVPLSVVAFHNTFFRQIRAAFVSGSYYPALTGACALGERILNHLILRLRKHFKATPQYKRVHQKDSFDDWTVAIDTLTAWGVLQTEVVEDYCKLRESRINAIHFRQDLDRIVREPALKACQLLSSIIEKQFGAFGLHPWFIRGTKGAAFISADFENSPFIKEVYLPNCRRVGPYHRLEYRGNWMVVIVADPPVEGRDCLTDDEFAQLFNNSSH